MTTNEQAAPDAVPQSAPESAPEVAPAAPETTTPDSGTEKPESPAEPSAQPEPPAQGELSDGEPEVEQPQAANAQLVLFPGMAVDGELAKNCKMKTSKTGARTISLIPRTSKKQFSMRDASGLKGQALDAYQRQQADALKVEACALASRVATDPRWVGRRVSINARRDMITFAFKRVEPMTVSTAKITPQNAMKALGLPDDMSIEDLKAAVAMLKDMTAASNAA